MKFKERETDNLYEAVLTDDGVMVRQCPPNSYSIDKLTMREFFDRFEESGIPTEQDPLG